MIRELLGSCRRFLPKSFNEVDAAFLLLRLATIFGGITWIIAAPVVEENIIPLRQALIFFSLSSLLLYSLILWKPRRIRLIYLLSFVLDLIFLFVFIHIQKPGFNSFFLGYYLLTALHTFYFGIRFGLIVATLSAFFLFLNSYPLPEQPHWSEIALRLTFLYCIAIPTGLLSEKFKKDQQKLEELNMQLEMSFANLKEAQQKLIEAEKYSALGRIAADIAHEIRNPLSALGGFARRLHKRLAPGSQEKQYTKIIISEVNRLETILRDTLIYSHFTRSSLKLTHLKKPIIQACLVFCDTCSEQRVHLVKNFAADLPPLYLDSDQIVQAVGNLVSNARDAMGDGGTLTVTTREEQIHGITYQLVEINDTGGGIPEDQIDYIFEPFFSTKKIGVGTGLGLAIVQRIMKEHSGFARLDRNSDTGTTIILGFPYQGEEERKKPQCWEVLGCGIEKDTSRRCPAYPLFGRSCWAISGTYCYGNPMGVYAEKIKDCLQCKFYQQLHPDDTADFPGSNKRSLNIPESVTKKVS